MYSDNKQNKNSFSFKIKILDNDKNSKKMKDIFIRKQDMYLIKLLEKRAKYIKSIKPDNSFKKIFSYDKNKTNRLLYYDNNIINNKTPIKKKLVDFQNIRIIKKQKDNTNNNNIINNYNLETEFDESKINKNNVFEDLITSKIYNSDMTRNNKTILNVSSENENNNIQNNQKEQNDIITKSYVSERTQTDDININKRGNKFLTNFINNQNFQSDSKNSGKINNIKLPKNKNTNFFKYLNEFKENNKYQLLFNEGLNSEKSISFKKDNPEFANIYKKINFIQKKIQPSIPISPQEKNYLNINLNKRLIQNNQIYNILKNEKLIQKQKIKKNIYYQITDDKNITQNNNLFLPNHALNKTKNKKTMENLFNGLPQIKMKYKMDL